MKKQYLKLLLVQILLIVFSLLQFIILKQFNVYIYVLEIVAIFFVLRYIFKVSIDHSFKKKDALLVIAISCLTYYALIYLCGFVFGFVYSTYSRSLIGIFKNVLSATIFVAFIEGIREIIISKSKYYKSLIILSIFTMSMLEILFSISLAQFSDRIVFANIFLGIILPCLFRNLFLTYSMHHFGILDSLVYHLIMVIIPYIVPVFPNLGDYMQTLLLILHPLITLFLCSSMVFYKREKIKDTDRYLKLLKTYKYLLIGVAVVAVIFVYLMSDLGRFTVMAIGSGSMSGSIEKGDIVFIDKKSKDYKINDVIAYNYNNTIIVHRIVNIEDFKVFKAYRTKGDNNNAEDAWLSYKEKIKGKVLFRIRFLGWPTVKLGEFLTDLKNR